MPAIVDTIFSKIGDAAAFVGDLTPVGSDTKNRPIPNPNVMIELGYAEKAIGNSRILTVANDHWYKGPESLPFNLRHRRGPIRYTLSPGAGPSTKKDVRQKLAKDLAVRLRPILLKAKAGGRQAMSIREPDSMNEGVWLPTNGFFHNDFHGGAGRQTFAIPVGPRLYARIAPTEWSPPDRTELFNYLRNDGPAWVTDAPFGDGGINADGAVQYFFYARNETPPLFVDTVTQWFKDNGEIWGVDTTAFVKEDNGAVYFNYAKAFQFLELFLRRSVKRLQSIEAGSEIRIEVGACRLLETCWWHKYRGQRPMAVLNSIQPVQSSRKKWSDQEIRRFLLNVWNRISDAYGRKPLQTLAEFEALTGLQQRDL